MVKLNLKEEERLVEEIRKFPWFYDKGNRGYEEKGKKMHGVNNENAIGFEEVT